MCVCVCVSGVFQVCGKPCSAVGGKSREKEKMKERYCSSREGWKGGREGGMGGEEERRKGEPEQELKKQKTKKYITINFRFVSEKSAL